MTGNSGRILVIVVLQLVGILAGAQLGKIAPLVEWYQAEVGLSLTLIGWFTSMIGIFVAAVALPAGWAIERAGPARTFVAGSAVMVIGGLALALLDAPWAVLAARLVEGAGYLVLVIATPALLAAISPERWKAPVLAIWGGFVPIGYAVADFSARAMLPETGPKIFLAAAIAAFAILAGLGALLLHAGGYAKNGMAEERAESSFAATMILPVWLTALAFGLFVVCSVGFFSFMPAYAGSRQDLLLSAGAIALFGPVGNILTSILVGGRSTRVIIAISAVSFLAAAAVAVPAYAASDPVSATLALVAFAVAGGLTASALFAAIPFIAPRAGSVSVAIGLVAQAGGIGTLFGPPLAGHVIESYGYPGFGLWLALISLAGAVTLLPLIATARRDSRPQTPR